MIEIDSGRSVLELHNVRKDLVKIDLSEVNLVEYYFTHILSFYSEQLDVA